MSELIDREAFLKQERKWYCDECDRRKGVKNGRKCFVYEIGEAPCRACELDDVLDDLEVFESAATRWVRCEDELPVKGEIVIVSDGKHTWDVGQYHCLVSDDRTRWWWKGHTIKTVKWWMRKKDALPEPPKEGEN